MFIALTTISPGAVRRAGTKLSGQVPVASRPAEPRLGEIDDITINMSLLPE